MNFETKPMSQIATHAACMAAGLRDGLRTAQFYARDMTRADGGETAPDSSPTALSRAVAAMARTVDGGMSRAADLSLQAFSPRWRSLPSPFDLAMRERLAGALTNTHATLSSEFTLYFFRAARLALEQWVERPHLVLEHRIEAVRRNFAPKAQDFKEPIPEMLAQLLLALAAARPIARCGALKPGLEFLKSVDLNIAVFSSACLALLLAQAGKPNTEITDSEFLAIVGQLIHNRLPSLAHMVKEKDAAAIAQLFAECLADY
ncbi:MAG: hypothetical protein KGO53_04185 [Alphaproteobacteria bacterium]|nr:hypothetical protein [Alphaproteobacteria bacterium]